MARFTQSTKPDLKTSQGLYELAKKSGLQKDADRVLGAQKGEEINKIFSGGFISDTFDVLNALQYGVTGLIKGKGFAEGVKTRQSFSDKDALGEFGIPGLIAGTALDIAVDPLTYLAPLTVLKKIPGAVKLGKAAKAATFGKRVERTINVGADATKGLRSVFHGGSKQSIQSIKEGGLRLGTQADVGKTFNKGAFGISTSNKKSVSEIFSKKRGGDTVELFFDKNAKIFKSSDVPQKHLDLLKRTKQPLTASELMSLAKKNGFDAIDLDDLELNKIIRGGRVGLKESEVLVFNPNILKTKEQLATKTFTELQGGTKAGKYLADKFVWMFGADSIFRETWERGVMSIGQGITNVSNLTRGIAKFSPKTASKLLTKDETGRFIRVGLNELKNKLSPQEFETVSKAWTKLDDLGREAVEHKLLDAGTFEANLGEYIKTAFTEFETAKNKFPFATKKLGIKGIKARKNLSPEKLKELGQIDNPAYLLFKSMFDLTKDVETAKIFSKVARQFASDVPQVGFKQLPAGKKLGALAGKYVPENVASYVNEMVTPVARNLGTKLVGAFKFNKVILNPATHARNIMSNTVLNWWKLGLGPWRADLYSQAIKQVTKGGKWLDEAKKAGYNIDTFAHNEFKGLLNDPQARALKGTLGKTWDATKTKLGDLYQGEENIAKMAAFIHQRKKGLNIENAWKAAESATFNYAQVTPFVRKMRSSLFGYPFITFSMKSAPVVAEAALKKPGRISVFGKIKNNIEKAADIETTARERAAEPQWVKDGFFIKLPMKDKHGRSSYFDLTYIIPFGDLVTGSLFRRNVDLETGTKESIAETAISGLPALNVIKEISKNQDFFGDKIWKDTDSTDKQLGDLMRHLTKTMAPPLVADQLPGGYKFDGTRRQKGIPGALAPKDDIKQQRTLMQELLRNVGAKIQPVDVDIQETHQEWGRKTGLESLLLDNEVLQPFSTNFISKDDK